MVPNYQLINWFVRSRTLLELCKWAQIIKMHKLKTNVPTEDIILYSETTKTIYLFLWSHWSAKCSSHLVPVKEKHWLVDFIMKLVCGMAVDLHLSLKLCVLTHSTVKPNTLRLKRYTAIVHTNLSDEKNVVWNVNKSTKKNTLITGINILWLIINNSNVWHLYCLVIMTLIFHIIGTRCSEADPALLRELGGRRLDALWDLISYGSHASTSP